MRFEKVLLLFDPDADGVHICALMLLYFQRWMPALLDAGRVVVIRAPMFALTHPRLPDPAHAWSQEHAQSIAAQWRRDGLDGMDLHRYLGLGSIPPQVLATHCIDPRTRTSRIAGAEDVAAVQAAFGYAQHAPR